MGRTAAGCLTVLSTGPYDFRLVDRTTGPEMEVPAETSSTELRRHPRIPTRFRCWCEAENITFYAPVANLSEGGLFLKTSTPLPTGAKAQLRMSIDGRDSIEVRATVMWKRDTGMGLKFETFPETSLTRLRKIVSDHRGKK